MEQVIHLEHVQKRYSSEPRCVEALVDIDLDIHAGEFVGVLGKSGAGKSTLINLLAGIDRISSGLIRVQGVDLSNLNEDQITLWRGKNVGVVYQTFQLLNQLSILDNMLLAMDFCNKLTDQASTTHALSLLRSLEIEDQAYKKPAQLSGGQKQRAAIARALANDPPIILADEPTGNLDSKTSAVILEIFAQLTKKGHTVIVVSHDSSKRHIFSRVIDLQDGKIINDTKK